MFEKENLPNKKVIIIFDTNSILDLYSITKENAEEIIEYFKNCNHYLYISEFVYEEFISHYRRVRQSTGGRNKIELFKRNFNDIMYPIEKKLIEIRNSNLYKGFETKITSNTEEQIASINKYKDVVYDEIKKVEQSFDFDYNTSDPIHDFVEYIIQQNSFKKYNQTEKIQMSIVAEQRIKLGLKPGLTDSKKENPYSRYYDVFIWFDLLYVASQYDKVIFIEDEKKLDWWDISQNTMASDLVNDWYDKYGSSKEIQLVSLIDYLSKNSEYINFDALLEFQSLMENLNRDIEQKIMLTNDILEKIYDCQLDFEDYILGETVVSGNISDVWDAEPINVDYYEKDKATTDFDSIYRLLDINQKVKFTYTASVAEKYDRESIPNNFYVQVEFIVNVKFSFAVLLDKDIDYELIDIDIDKNNIQSLITEINHYQSDEYDYEEECGFETCPNCNSRITDDNYNMNGFCLNCNRDDPDI